ncbi:MAG: hypothetical protein ACD_5C00045G0003 [uncultured bacterium]|nr:MAG: hypothetical protein ACD_5C00045G0003 [uncultured bacterium]
MALMAFGDIFRDDDKKVFIIGSHQLALYYWSIGVQEKTLQKNAILIHIDFHSDFLNHRVSGISDNPNEILEQVRRRKIKNDTFIKYAISVNIVNQVIFCCKPQNGEINNVDPYVNYISPVLLVGKVLKKDLTFPENLILDIDLDFFVDFECETMKLKDESQIIEEIEAINVLFQYAKVTTISTSHDWMTWDDEQREFVQNLFEQYFMSPVSFSCNPERIF